MRNNKTFKIQLHLYFEATELGRVEMVEKILKEIERKKSEFNLFKIYSFVITSHKSRFKYHRLER
jgi:hypothetical protein